MSAFLYRNLLLLFLNTFCFFIYRKEVNWKPNNKIFFYWNSQNIRKNFLLILSGVFHLKIQNNISKKLQHVWQAKENDLKLYDRLHEIACILNGIKIELISSVRTSTLHDLKHNTLILILLALFYSRENIQSIIHSCFYRLNCKL